MYLLDFFFIVRSAFKGRFWSILATIRDQSCLNLIGIESRMQGDHEEFKILLQNCLMSSRFNQELSYKEEEHWFYRKIADRPIRWRRTDGHDRAINVGHDPTIPDFMPVWSSSMRLDASTFPPRWAKCVINHNRSISLMKSMVHIDHVRWSLIGWTPV